MPINREIMDTQIIFSRGKYVSITISYNFYKRKNSSFKIGIY
jgi:hypothetical protein